MCNGDTKVEKVEIDLDYVLSYKSVDGRPYICDISRWLHTDDLRLCNKVADKLKELQDRL
jgi:hypothetical protein